MIQENTPAVSNQNNQQEGPAASTVTERDLKVTVEKELVSQAEEEDMEALLGTCVPFHCLFCDVEKFMLYLVCLIWGYLSLVT